MERTLLTLLIRSLTLGRASDKVEEAKAKGLDVTMVESMLVEADETLCQAKAAYEEGNCMEAEYLAEIAEHLAEEILRKTEEPEHTNKQGDEEAYMIVNSSDNNIKLKKESSK